jgi:hypothetical protein
MSLLIILWIFGTFWHIGLILPPWWKNPAYGKTASRCHFSSQGLPCATHIKHVSDSVVTASAETFEACYFLCLPNWDVQTIRTVKRSNAQKIICTYQICRNEVRLCQLYVAVFPRIASTRNTVSSELHGLTSQINQIIYQTPGFVYKLKLKLQFIIYLLISIVIIPHNIRHQKNWGALEWPSTEVPQPEPHHLTSSMLNRPPSLKLD